MAKEVQSENIKLSEIIDLNVLQKFQDAFAKSMDIASITVDSDGPVTSPSNFTDFCFKYTRGSSLGYQRCNKCDLDWGKLAAEKGEPEIYTCHSGLTDFAVPIMLNGQHVGSILGGQVLTQKPNEEHFRELAREFGINEDDYIAALRKIKIIPFEQVEAAAQLLYVVANSISDMAHKNYELIKNSRKEKFLNNIVETIRDTLDIDQTLALICDEMGKLFNVQRVLIAEFANQETCADFNVKQEYKAQTIIAGLDFKNVDKKAAQYWGENLFEKLDTLALDDILNSDTPEYFKNSYKNIGVKSMVGAAIKKDRLKWGMIILFDYDKQRHWTEDEINFIKMISDQIYVSIQHARLHLANQKQTEREVLLRKIIETIRSSLDMDKTLNFICEEVAKLFNVQRATIVQFPNPENYEIYKIRTEFKTNIDVKGLTSSKYTTRAAGYWGNNLAVVDEILAFDNIQESDTPDYFRQCYSDLGVKSMIGFSIKDGGRQWGSLVLSEYNEYRHWTEEEISLLKDISNQIYIAIEQSELYEKEKKTAQREAILRNITEKIRSSLNLEETASFICEETAKLFNVQRVVIASFLDSENYKLSRVKKEYRSFQEVRGICDSTAFKDVSTFWTSSISKSKMVLAYDNIEESDAPEFFKQNYKSLGVKSAIGTPIRNDNDIWGCLILFEYDIHRHWAEEEIILLETIATQVYIAIQQAELYSTSKQKNEMESTLRMTIDILRSTLDAEEIKRRFVDIIGSYFDADRCLFDDYNKETGEFLPFRIEKLKYPQIPSLVGCAVEKDFPEFLERLKSGKNVIIRDLEKTLSKRNLISYKTFQTLSQCDVKSDYGLLVNYKDQIMGILVVHFVREKRSLTHEEIGFLKVLTDQVGIALYQAELYKTLQQTAENEKALRTIMSSSVDNFDIKDVINSTITETCQLFGADRCLFIEQTNSDGKLKNYSEYLSSPDILSATTCIPEEIIVDAMIKLINTREIKISNDVSKDNLLEETKHLLIDSLSVKSFLVAPVFYGEISYGAIILHYVRDYRQFSNEEIDLIKSIAKQSAAVMHHAMLYQQIEKNEKYTRTVLNSINDCIITINNDFVIETCNPAVEAIWGYSSTDCIGKPLSLLLNYNCEGRKKAECLAQKSICGIKNNGEIFPVEINFSNVVTEDKKLILLTIRDITERKRIEQMKNEFVSTVSHELRTPLTSLRGSLGLILSGKMGDLSEKVKGLLDIANNNCSRLINLINDILDIEKIEAGKMDFEIKAFEVMPLINQAIQLNLQFAQKFNVEINLVQTVENVFVKVDASRLIQVITNLLSNAIKFSQSGSAVDVSVTKVGRNVRVSVTNYGGEIPQDFKNRIFQKFAQADSSDSRQKGGTGLGLSISKAIVEKMNGNIQFTSENNITTFYIDLPEFFENSKGTPNEQTRSYL